MKPITIFFQGEGIEDIALFEAEAGESLSDLLAKFGHEEAKSAELSVFLEDLPGVLDKDMLVEELVPLGTEEHSDRPLRLHINRCRQIMVSVRFNAETRERRFPPSTTVERVRRWVALRAFHMAPQDAAEHILQLQGSTLRPDRDTHLGTLTDGHSCAVAFDLVPAKRVEG